MSSIRLVFKGVPLVFFTLVFGCVFPACRKPVKEGKEDFLDYFGSQKKINYPIERVISDKAGRPLDAIIVGRSGTELYLARKSDNMEFAIPIENLSQADRDFANALPLKSGPAGFGKTSHKKTTDDHPYIKSREAAIKQLREKNRILEDENLNSGNTMLIRNRSNQIEKNTKEINQMEADIDRYKVDHNLN